MVVGEDRGACARIDDRWAPPVERLAEHVRLDPAKRLLAVRFEDVRDLLAVAGLDLAVDVDDRPEEPRSERRRHRRLPRAHEPDQRDVPVERVQRHEMRSR